jgi:hypothetical protein
MSQVYEICKKLHLYYQATILDTATKDLQILVERFVDTITERLLFTNKNKEFEKAYPLLNRSLVKLLFNYYNPRLDSSIYKMNKLTGPYTLTSLSSHKHKKNVYLFGEQHPMEGPCIKTVYGKPDSMVMVKYIRNILEETSVFLDVYIEDSIDHEPKQRKIDMIKYGVVSEKTLLNIRTDLSDCVEQTKTCEWNDVSRIHYIDVRGSIQPKTNKDFSSLFTVNHDLLWMEDLEFSTKWCKIMQNITLKEYIKYAQNQFIHGNKYMKKELSRSTHPKEITDWVFKKLKLKIYKGFNVALEAIQKIAKGPKPDNYVFLQLKGFLSGQAVVMTDGYALARVFKVFNKKGNLKAPREPHNIIMYAGSSHTINYIDFMKNEMGFKIHDEIVNHDVSYLGNCLNMSTIKQPLFSQFEPFEGINKRKQTSRKKVKIEAGIFDRKFLTAMTGIEEHLSKTDRFADMKVKQMSVLIKKYQIESDKVWFYDDNKTNINRSIEEGINGVLVPKIPYKTCCLTPKMLDKLIKLGPEKVKLVVFDFDHTFANVSFSSDCRNSGIDWIIKHCLGGKVRINKLFKQVLELEAIGVKIGFITFNGKVTVENLLKKLKWR